MNLEDNSQKKASGKSKCLAFLKSQVFVLTVMAGVILGFVLGFGLGTTKPSKDLLMWIGLPGEVFMRLMKVTILPIIVSSIIVGTASMGPKSNGRISALAIGFFVVMNTVGSFLGVMAYFIFRPGENTPFEPPVTSNDNEPTKQLETQDMFADLIRNIFPDNIVTSSFEKAQTSYEFDGYTVQGNLTNITSFSRTVTTASTTNIIGVIFMCSAIGMAAAKVGEPAKVVIQFFEGVSDIFIYILKWFIWSTPLGVASLIASSVANVDDLGSTFSSLGMFILAYTIAIVFQELVVAQLLYLVIFRKNPLKFVVNSLKPMMAAFGPPSSAVSIPVAIDLTEKTYGVDKRISRFVVPFGAQESRCGSALFIAFSSLFLMASEGVHPGVVHVLIIGFLTAVSSLAIPSVPSASIISILIILSSVSVQAKHIGLLMALEWYTDRLRATSNVLHNVLCTLVTNKFGNLRDSDEETRPDDQEKETVNMTDDVNEQSDNCKLDRLRSTSNVLHNVFGTLVVDKYSGLQQPEQPHLEIESDGLLTNGKEDMSNGNNTEDTI